MYETPSNYCLVQACRWCVRAPNLPQMLYCLYVVASQIIIIDEEVADQKYDGCFFSAVTTSMVQNKSNGLL